MFSWYGIHDRRRIGGSKHAHPHADGKNDDRERGEIEIRRQQHQAPKTRCG